MLRDLLNKELLLAFQNELADAYKPFVLKRVTITRDKTTDENVTATSTFDGKGVFGSFEKSDIDGSNVVITDIKLLILQSQLATIPTEGDQINDYRIVHIFKDPVDVTWVLALRKYNGLES